MVRVLLLFLFPALLAAGDRPRVLLLFSNDRLLPANQEMERGIRSAFEDNGAELFGEFLDAVRFPGPEQSATMERFLAERHRNHPIAACVCIGPQSLEFLAQRKNPLFSGVPVIVAAVTPPQLAALPSVDGMAGRPMDWNIRPLLEKLPEIRPEVRRILVVTGAAEFDTLREHEAKAQMEPYRGRLEFEFCHGESVAELKARLAKLKDDTLVFYITYFKTPDGTTTVPQDVARELASASSVPVACVYDTYLGTGVLGGAVMPFHEEGRFIGNIARQVIAQGGVSKIGMQPAGEPRLVFDERVMKRFGWNPRQVPPGTEIRFHEGTLWENHKLGVLGAGGVVLLQSGLIAGLLAARSRQRAAERERSLSESRFGRVFLGSPVPINIIRRSDGRILDVNPAWEQTMGVPREMAVGATHAGLGFVFESSPEGGLRDYLASGKALRDFEQEVRLPNGSKRLISTSTELIDLHGESCYVSMTQDVTDRHQAEEARQLLFRSARLGMLGELTASIAHEVNQPLGAILSNTEAAELLMKSGHPPLDEIRAILADIRRDDLRAGEVIRQVRQMVSRGEAKRSAVDMSEVVASVLAMIRHDCKRRGIHLASRIADDMPPVSGERVQLEQVLLNLLLNAMDAVTTPGVQNREIRVSLESLPPDAVSITVADNGPGIPEDLRKRVFESFFTTKPDGMGLGLALSRTIAEAHGGSLSAEKSASPGAAVRLILPALHET